jgi:hypothetical protein
MVHDCKDRFKLTLQLSVVPAYGGARFECFVFLLALLHVCSSSQRKLVDFLFHAFLCGLLFPECLGTAALDAFGFLFFLKKKFTATLLRRIWLYG